MLTALPSYLSERCDMRALNTVLNEDIISGLAPTQRVRRLIPHRKFAFLERMKRSLWRSVLRRERPTEDKTSA